MNDRIFLLGLVLLALSLPACSSLRPPETVLKEAPLELESYFAGQTRSWGILEDRFGKVRQQFTAELTGIQRGEVFHLDQRFTFADGRTERRLWEIWRVDGRHYEATATGIQGTARAEIQGGAVHLWYTMAAPVGKRTVKVQFDQWMWRTADGVLFNRADVSKLGVRVARVSELFQK